jgi:integrase
MPAADGGTERFAARMASVNHPSEGSTSCNPSHCSTVPGAAARQQRWPSFHQGVPPRNKGLRYPPGPPSVEEISSVMRTAGDTADGLRLRGLIVVLWRAGLRISEALALSETDLDPERGAILIRCGKGGTRREVGMDRWAWNQLQPWLTLRALPPVGALFCIVRGPTRGRPCAPAGIRAQLRRTAQTPESDTDTRPPNSGTHTPWRCPARASRSW